MNLCVKFKLMLIELTLASEAEDLVVVMDHLVDSYNGKIVSDIEDTANKEKRVNQ